MTRATYLYRTYDADDRLLYIGVTDNPARRWQQHRNGSLWAAQAVRFRMAGPYSRDTALRLERDAQVTERPAFGAIPGDTNPDRALRAARAASDMEKFDALWMSHVAVSGDLIAAATYAAALVDAQATA